MPELVVPIKNSLIDSYWLQGSYIFKGFQVVQLKSSFQKFKGHHFDFINRYCMYVLQMATYMFRLSLS